MWVIKMAKVEIVQFRWAGSWGPFKIKSECEECGLVKAMMEALIEKEFKGKDVSFTVKPWLDNWIYCLKRLVYHPPILMMNGKAVYQFHYWKKLPDIDKIKSLIRLELEKK